MDKQEHLLMRVDGRRPATRLGRLPPAIPAPADIGADVPEGDGSAPALCGFIAGDFAHTIRGAKRRVERDLALGILRILEQHPAISQRALARRLGVSIGVANAYVARCVAHGLVSKSPSGRVGRGCSYVLSEKGQRQKEALVARRLEFSLAPLARLRAEYRQIFRLCRSAGARAIRLVGAGDLADIARLELGPAGFARWRLAAGPEDLAAGDVAPGTALVVTDASTPSRTFRALLALAARPRPEAAGPSATQVFMPPFLAGD
jgi:DNA-binding MarR family transcriptional regulator